ncbi:MAG: ABC-transp-aux domain-containing protein [Clostridium sp.]|jgi:ABC-2 type transport system permease protein
MNQEKDPRTGASIPEQEHPENMNTENEQIKEETQKESPAPEKENAETTQNPKAEENDGDSQKSEKQEKKKKTEKKKTDFFKSAKFRHGSVSTAFTAGFIVVVVLVNILVGILGERFPSINIDLTKNAINSLSAEGAKAVDAVDIPTTITVLATKQQVESNLVGDRYSEVGILLDKIAERNSNIKVNYLDLDKSPTFAAEYKNENLAVGDIIVKTDKRYRVVTYSDLFQTQYSMDYTSTQVYSNVEGALVTALNAVISDKLPIVAFDTGHRERQDMSAYKKLLEDNNFETTDFNLLTDQIPENTQMIVLGMPTNDYTDDEIKKLSDFLSDKTFNEDRSLMVTFAPSQAEMPKLATFLEEWGIQVPRAVIVESDQSKFISNNPTDILSDIQSDVQLRDDKSQRDYGYFITPQSCPVNLLYESRNDRITYSLAKSSDSCYLVDSSTESTDNLPKQSSNTVALSRETLKNEDKTFYANVIAVGSSALFTDGIINSDTFGNGLYMVDLAKYATGTSDSSTEVQISAKPLNAKDIIMTSQVSTFLGLGVFIIFIPVLVAVIGIFVYHKRRHL